MDGGRGHGGTATGPSAAEDVRGGPLTAMLGLAAAVLQTLLLGTTFLLGLVWGSWTWLTALAVMLVGLVAVVVLTLRRRRSVIAVPVVCAALGVLLVGLSFLGPAPFGTP